MKMWYLCTMEFYSATKKSEFYCLQVNVWNLRTSFFSFIVVLCGGTWWHLQCISKALTMYQMYHTLIYLLHYSPLSLSYLITGIVSLKGIIFTFLYMCTHFWCCLHSSTPFPATSLLPLVR
jgi:hypothetical protein